jgi:imidazolonepropionase-like amidohydrolase
LSLELSAIGRFLAPVCIAASGAIAQTQTPQSAGTQPTLALTHVRVIDGTGMPARADQTLVISDGKISAVGAPAGITIPTAARVIDLSGHSIMPGLVMLHEHLKFDPQGEARGGFAQPQPFSAPRLYLAFGVTTIRSAGAGHPFVELNLKRDIDLGRTPGPELFLTSPYFNGPDSPFLDDMIVRNGDEARRAVRYWADAGFTSMKAYTALPKEALAAMIDEAHALHLTVLAHLGQSVSCREAAELGIDSIEHGFGPCVNNTTDNLGRDPDGPPARALIELLIDKHVALTVTPVPMAPTLTDSQLELLHPIAREAYAIEVKARPPVPPRAATAAPQPMVPRLVLAFARAGGRLVLGSDAGCCSYAHFAGVADHQALIRLIDFGFTPLEAIRIATSDGAWFLGIDARTGSIAAGKEADLLVVNGDPSVRITDVEKVETVFSNGLQYSPADLLAEVKGLVGWR